MSQAIASRPSTTTAQGIVAVATEQLQQLPPLDRESGSRLVIHLPRGVIDGRSLGLLENGQIDLVAEYADGRTRLVPDASWQTRTHRMPITQENSIARFEEVAEQVMSQLMGWIEAERLDHATGYFQRIDSDRARLAWRREGTLRLVLFRV